MDSDVSYTPTNDDESVVLTEPFLPSSPLAFRRQEKPPKILPSHPDFVLNDSESTIYIIVNSLFRRTLLPPSTEGTDRQIKVIYTQYVFILFFSFYSFSFY